MTKIPGKESDVPDPQSPWDEISPGLWMGGHVWSDPAGEPRPVVVADEFDLVISLFTRSGHGPGPGTEHLVAEMPDSVLTAGQLHTVRGSPAPPPAPSTPAARSWSAATRATTAPGSSSPSASWSAVSHPPRPSRSSGGGAPRGPCTTRCSPPIWPPVWTRPPSSRSSTRSGRGSPAPLGARTSQDRRTVIPLSPTVCFRLRGGTGMRTVQEAAPEGADRAVPA